ncbi:thioredoxin domain-containing protein 5 homolog [Episyrphus balteatus]|uniref:thioredoxin domain-containing protein 5 homolog n=1 Tax=Episyrphus balteatus TaxID=286459 RepID=UPI002485F702|nr:thioredoxin domain-containing protein 5 homolog [Episyrphus balteatus]
MIVKISLLLALLCPAIVFADSEENFAIALSPETFDNAIKENNHFIMFFAPWCGHCKRLHPLWEQLAEMMNVKEDAKVIIAKVDCTEHQKLCAQNEVTGYPTLRFFKLGETESVKFKGSRDMPAMTEFIQQQLGSENEIPTEDDSENEIEQDAPSAKKLVELTENNFASHVSSGNHFVKFYAPWCSHCQRLAPVWDELANSLKDETSVSIAKIDCTLYRPICQDFEVKSYPILLWIEDGKKIEKYSGSRSLGDFQAYVKKMLGGSAKKNEVDDSGADEKDEDPTGVVQLSGEAFENTVKNGITFVKFYAPWCGHCQKLSPVWDQLAAKTHSKNLGIKIAKVDCTQSENKELCQEQQVEGYPTLFAYKNGDKLSEYEGGRSLEDLNNYIVKLVGHDEL